VNVFVKRESKNLRHEIFLVIFKQFLPTALLQEARI